MATQSSTTGMKKTLGLTGVTVNAMALIAPGAFLWMTFQLQAANTDIAGNSTAKDMWTGIVAALIVAFLTAFAYAELAGKYPEAGTGSAYYFAEKAFLDREEPSHRRWARISKFITGWAAHLFYWVYPGVMVAFFAVLVTYILGVFGYAMPIWQQIVVAWLFSIAVGYIAIRGVTGSTVASVVINVIQLVSLIVFSILAIIFRVQNPLGVSATGWYHPAITSIVIPHNLGGLLFQSTIAILILVGFESSTAFAAEAKNPEEGYSAGCDFGTGHSRLICLPLRVLRSQLCLERQTSLCRWNFEGYRCSSRFRRPDWGYGHPDWECLPGRQRFRLHARDCRNCGYRDCGYHPGRHEHRRPHQLCHGAGCGNARYHGSATR